MYRFDIVRLRPVSVFLLSGHASRVSSPQPRIYTPRPCVLFLIASAGSYGTPEILVGKEGMDKL